MLDYQGGFANLVLIHNNNVKKWKVKNVFVKRFTNAEVNMFSSAVIREVS